MSKTIVLWSVFLWACVFATPNLQAMPICWEEGYQYIRSDSQVLNGIGPSGLRRLYELGEANKSDRTAVIPKASTLGAMKSHQHNIPMVAIPETETLILLGLGLAGLASLFRRKS